MVMAGWLSLRHHYVRTHKKHPHAARGTQWETNATDQDIPSSVHTVTQHCRSCLSCDIFAAGGRSCKKPLPPLQHHPVGATSGRELSAKFRGRRPLLQESTKHQTFEFVRSPKQPVVSFLVLRWAQNKLREESIFYNRSGDPSQSLSLSEAKDSG